jgi:hypothetical protein
MAERMSIYAGPPLLAALAGFENRSGRLNDVAERYLAIIAEELKTPRFRLGEWCAIMDVLNGSQIDVGGRPDSQWCWVSMAESPEMDTKWGIDHEALAARMRSLPLAARAAIHEAAGRFYREPERETEVVLKAIGIVCLPE